MPDTLTDDVLAAISRGVCDDNLDGLRFAVNERRSSVARNRFHAAKPGDTGHMVSGRPTYLLGAPFTVVRKAKTKLVVKLRLGGTPGRSTARPSLSNLDPR